MQKRFNAEVRSTLLALLFILGLAVALFVLPRQFQTEANSDKGLIQRTTVEQGLPNFDIRDEANNKNEDALRAITEFRTKAGKNEFAVSAVRSDFVSAENVLRTRVPSLKVEYNQDIRIPEVIGVNVWDGRQFLTGRGAPAGQKHANQLIDFLQQNNSLVGVSDEQISGLKVAADYTNPNGVLSFVELNQEINGIPVFRGEVKAGFTQAGEMIRVINNLAPGIDYSTVSTDFKNPVDAVRSAAENLKWSLKDGDTTPNAAASGDLKVRFGNGGDSDITAEKMYFPTEPGVARAAWRVLIWEPVTAYYVIVDAETGIVLWRKNLGADQTQAATYNVYANATSLGKAMNSPAPLVPGPIDPTPHTQAALGTRTDVTLIGNEGPLSFNNLGWITDGTNGVNGFTDGNNNEAGLDIVAPDGVDAPQAGTNRVFSFAYNPSNVTGGVEGGDPLTNAAYRSGTTTNLFYLANRYHDVLYQAGFTEAARNFQNDNFGRGGAAADRVRSEVQDSSGTNNANMSTPADGGRGRMQMYVFTNGTAPGRDGSLDSDVVFHELTHGTSNRLVGNASGLTSNRAGSSGEGWGDLYGSLMNLTPSVPVNSVLVTGGYVTYKCCGATTFVDNYFYGIRRLPYAPIGFTGGPNNRPFNPLTLADIGTTTATDGAFPCSTLITCPGTANEVHNAGEVWAVTGVEVWGRIATRLGPGNAVTAATKTIQLYTDGMKLSPLNPTYIQSRDSVIAAAAALPLSPDSSNDVADVREGFRLRGMGFSATDNGTAVVEAFDTPNVLVSNPFAVLDTPGNNNGFPEPGENVLLSIPVRNPNTGATINNVMVSVNGGASVSYGSIADGATVTNNVPFAISSSAICGSTVTVTINVTSSAGAQVPTTRSFVLGAPGPGLNENFDALTAPALPTGWTTAITGSGVAWVTNTTTPDTAPNAIFTTDPATASSSEVTTVDIPVNSAAAQLQFRLNYNTELGWDGMVLEISIGGGAFQDFVTAGGTFTQNGYPRALNTGSANPLTGRNAWTGNSAGYVTVVGTMPAAANGTNVKLKFRAGSDGSVAGVGVRVDGIQTVSSYNCVALTPRSRADYDGDGRSDPSVFRPSTGDWYSQRSTSGFQAIHWGATGDVVIPGDYDGDLKADWAVWRPSDTPNVTDFFVLNSNGFTFNGYSHGLTTDIPVPGDFDGDGKFDVAVFRPSNGNWYIWGSQAQTTTTQQFGTNGDIPLAIDKDGDGKANLSVYRPSTNTFFMANATGAPAQNFTSVQWGLAGDILVPADYDGDSKEDVAVFRPSNGFWYIFKSTGGTQFTQFGLNGDVPVPGDYDGDGTDDIAVYRNGTWYENRSTQGFQTVAFGTPTDVPVERRYLATP